jgi:transposase
MIAYFKSHGATKAALRFMVSRKTVYKWVNRYDGSLRSLKDLSHKPHTSPKAHTDIEITMIKRALQKVKWQDLILAYQRLISKGYTRSYGAFKRIANKLRLLKINKPKPKRKLKPYTRADYPGQKLQIDVKYVPRECIVGGKPYYQFTAVDECTRWTYRQMYDDKSSYSAKLFLDELMGVAPFPIRKVQTDNGTEFTNALIVTKSKYKSLFEQTLEDMDIEYQRIRIATPRHNGKVERMHRTDQLRFYNDLKMYSLADGRRQLASYQKKSNGYIMTCLDMKSPNETLKGYLGVMF